METFHFVIIIKNPDISKLNPIYPSICTQINRFLGFKEILPPPPPRCILTVFSLLPFVLSFFSFPLLQSSFRLRKFILEQNSGNDCFSRVVYLCAYCDEVKRQAAKGGGTQRKKPGVILTLHKLCNWPRRSFYLFLRI